LGLILCGAEPDQVEARLNAYEAVRRERASAVQIMSNVGQDQIAKIQDEVAKYTKSVPSESISHPLRRPTYVHLLQWTRTLHPQLFSNQWQQKTHKNLHNISTITTL